MAGIDELPPISETLDLGFAGEDADDITLEDFDALEGEPVHSSGRRLQRVRYTRDRLWLLGLGTQKMVGAGGYNLTFLARCAALFRPRRIALSACSIDETYGNALGSLLGALWIDDIKIASKSQLAAPGGFPAAAFEDGSDDTLVKFDTAAPGREIELNISIAPGWDETEIEIYVSAGMFGYSAAREK